MGFVSGYSMDLYCDGGKDCPLKGGAITQYTGETFAEVSAEARRDGWIIDKNGNGRERGYAICPACIKRKATS